MRLCDVALVLLCAGCASQVESTIEVTPPSPAPTVAAEPTIPAPAATPTDEDGDGVVANDKCPSEKETKNGYEDADGCPDVVPDFYVKEHDIVYTGELKFGLLGGLLNSSQPTIAGIAALLTKHTDLELVEIAVHITDGADQEKKSQDRAKAVVKALAKAGVVDKRLRAMGYGKRCPDGGSRVELKVVRRAGAETGATLCGR